MTFTKVNEAQARVEARLFLEVKRPQVSRSLLFFVTQP
jgi:hypothetical protein